jgi:tetratricopeptide (TPR) repeat protein
MNNDNLSGNTDVNITSENNALAEEFFLKAVTFTKEGRLEEALQNFKKTISLNPENGKAYFFRGLIYADLDKKENAIVDYSKAIELDKDNLFSALAYYQRGVIYEDAGNFNKAIADYNCAIEIKSDYTECYYGRAFCYTKLNNFSKAISDWNKIIEITPEELTPRKKRASLILQFVSNEPVGVDLKAQLELVLEDCNKSITLNPSDGEIYHLRGIAYTCLGEIKKGEDDIKKAQRLGTKESDLPKSIINQYKEDNKYKYKLKDIEPFSAFHVNKEQAKMFLEKITGNEIFDFKSEKNPLCMMIYHVNYSYPNQCTCDAYLLSIGVDKFLSVCELGEFSTMEPIMKQYTIGKIHINYSANPNDFKIVTGEVDWSKEIYQTVNINCHCGEKLEISKIDEDHSSLKTCSVCGCVYGLGKNEKPLRTKIGFNDNCEIETEFDSNYLQDQFYRDLMVKGVSSFMFDNDIKKSVSFFKKAITLRSCEAGPRIELARVKIELYKDSKHIHTILNDLNYAEDLINKGTSTDNINKFDGKDIIEYVRSKCYYLLQKYELAEAHAKKALKIDSEIKEAKELLIQISQKRVNENINSNALKQANKESVSKTNHDLDKTICDIFAGGGKVGYVKGNKIHSGGGLFGGKEVGYVKGNKIHSGGGLLGGKEVGYVKGNKIYSGGGLFGGKEVGYVKGNKIYPGGGLFGGKEVGYLKGNMQESESILFGGAALLLIIHIVNGVKPKCPYEGRVLAEKETKVLGFKWPYQSEIFKIHKNWKVTTLKDSSFGWIDVKGEIHKGVPFGGIDPNATLSCGYTGLKIWHSGCYNGNDKIGSLVKW